MGNPGVLALVLGVLQAVSAGTLEPLTVYNGSWTVAPAAHDGSTPKADQLTNHCHMVDAFYTCEQVVNGKPVALLVFTPTATPGLLHSQVILPDGNPGGKASELTIAGPHWTFLNKDDKGKPAFRVENFFSGRDKIHYEQWKATADGSWEKVGEGDEVRVGASGGGVPTHRQGSDE
jgi:hypothetical protein